MRGTITTTQVTNTETHSFLIGLDLLSILISTIAHRHNHLSSLRINQPTIDTNLMEKGLHHIRIPPRIALSKNHLTDTSQADDSKKKICIDCELMIAICDTLN